MDIHQVIVNTVKETHMTTFLRGAFSIRTCTPRHSVLQKYDLLENIFSEDEQSVLFKKKQSDMSWAYIQNIGPLLTICPCIYTSMIKKDNPKEYL